jgi:uncharacterized protein
MNYLDFFTMDKKWGNFKPDPLTNIILYTTDIFFSAKSWTLLSLLFGYGFAVLMNNIKEKGHNPYGFFAGRMFWLLVLAFINSALFMGDILKDYAFLGLIMLCFYKASAKTTFIAMLLLLLGLPALNAYINSLNDAGWQNLIKIIPLYKSNNLLDVLWFGLKGTYVAEMISKPYLYTVHVVMLCCMLMGFWLYKISFFNNLLSNKKYVKRYFWIFLSATILLIAYSLISKELKWTFKNYYSLRYWTVLSTMLFLACAFCWLYLAERLKTFFGYLTAMGKMTLTNYMTQNLIGMLVFSGFGLGIFNSKPLWFYTLLALIVYALQVVFSIWWLKRYNYGPIEWVWRQLSYRKRLPLKKA